MTIVGNGIELGRARAVHLPAGAVNPRGDAERPDRGAVTRHGTSEPTACVRVWLRPAVLVPVDGLLNAETQVQQPYPPPPPAPPAPTSRRGWAAPPHPDWARLAALIVFAEAAFFLLSGVPFLLGMLVLFASAATGGVPAGVGVVLGILLTTVGVGLTFAARGLARKSAGARRVTLAVQLAILAFALVSIPLGLVDSWPIWIGLVAIAALVLYAMLFTSVGTAVVARPPSSPQQNRSAVMKSPAWATMRKAAGISVAIVAVLIVIATAVLFAFFLLIWHGLGQSG